MTNIKVVLKPKQGIKVDSSNKYLYDPTIVQGYEDASKEYSEKAMMSEANAKDSENNAKQHELSAKEYKEQAGLYSEQAREYAEQISLVNVQQVVNENVGRLNQIGYYGTLVGNTLTFEKPYGEEEYELKKGFTYLVDLQFEAVGELDDSVKIVIKNNDNNVNIVNVIHSNPDELVTVGELKQIMRYNTVGGWRWIFNAWYTETQGGSRVLVMPSTVVAGGGSGGTVDVDGAMSDTSENPVQNKVIKSYVDTTEQDIISGYMDADSELQIQINGQAQAIANKQEKLISGSNIKTINGQILLGSGDLEIKSGGSITLDTEMSDTSENPVQNKVIKSYVDSALENVGSVTITYWE